MRFYTRQHVHYCGIDLHASSLYVCILDQKGETLVHRKLPCDREKLLNTLAPYRPTERTWLGQVPGTSSRGTSSREHHVRRCASSHFRCRPPLFDGMLRSTAVSCRSPAATSPRAAAIPRWAILSAAAQTHARPSDTSASPRERQPS